MAETKKPTPESTLRFDTIGFHLGAQASKPVMEGKSVLLNGIFTTLPVDVTFIDADDTTLFQHAQKKNFRATKNGARQKSVQLSSTKKPSHSEQNRGIL